MLLIDIELISRYLPIHSLLNGFSLLLLETLHTRLAFTDYKHKPDNQTVQNDEISINR